MGLQPVARLAGGSPVSDQSRPDFVAGLGQPARHTPTGGCLPSAAQRQNTIGRGAAAHRDAGARVRLCGLSGHLGGHHHAGALGARHLDCPHSGHGGCGRPGRRLWRPEPGEGLLHGLCDAGGKPDPRGRHCGDCRQDRGRRGTHPALCSAARLQWLGSFRAQRHHHLGEQHEPRLRLRGGGCWRGLPRGIGRGLPGHEDHGRRPSCRSSLLRPHSRRPRNCRGGPVGRVLGDDSGPAQGGGP